MQYTGKEYTDYDSLRDQSSDVKSEVNYDVRPFDASDTNPDQTENYEVLKEDDSEEVEVPSDDQYESLQENNDVMSRLSDGTDDPYTEEYFEDSEKMRDLVAPFKPETWEGLDLEERKEALINFQRFNNELLGLEPSPDIDFYNNEQEGDYGGFSSGDNAIHVNEYMLDDAEEALDTIAHESRHAYQQMHATDPQSARDFEFAENFDNYVSPEDDFEGYQAQIVEADARAYAARYKEYLASM